jgi:sulfatase maturation enzyme AslB (radical SAM superfamily)
MFRLTQYMRELVAPTPVRARRGAVKPVVIWNLTRTCNLRCRHCYTTSADVPFPGELTHEQAMAVLDDLHGFGIPALILSGGEPLSRFDFLPPGRAGEGTGVPPPVAVDQRNEGGRAYRPHRRSGL